MTASPNLLDSRPEILADRHDAAEALDAVIVADELSDRQQASLRFALSFWVVQAIERASDLESVLLLDKLCAAATQRVAAEASPSGFAFAMQTMRALLENKRLSIAGGESGRAKKLLRASAILNALEDGELTQSELSERLQLSAGRISQLLSVMEEGGMIRRVRRGRESVVSRIEANSVYRAEVPSEPQRSTVRPMLAFQLAA